jgi:hypothetical protein
VIYQGEAAGEAREYVESQHHVEERAVLEHTDNSKYGF